ncbi:ATP-binding cassette domain-containing protein, partial [Pseudomonas aeruginosa]
IIGSSGSGKSTFLRCINLLEQPHAGKILLNGEELKLVPGRDGALKAADSRQLQRMRSRLSMVFQHFNLWSHMSALENVIEAPVHVIGLLDGFLLRHAEHMHGRLDDVLQGAHVRPRVEMLEHYRQERSHARQLAGDGGLQHTVADAPKLQLLAD